MREDGGWVGSAIMQRSVTIGSTGYLKRPMWRDAIEQGGSAMRQG